MADAECYQKTPEDRTIILNARAFYVQPFVAGDWTDLRLGFFLSLTDPTNDDLTTGLVEAMGLTGSVGPHDRYWIGVAAGEPGKGGYVRPRPRRPGEPPPPPSGNAGVFIGFTNTVDRFPNIRAGDSVLVSSDAGVGTTNANFWRPANAANDKWGAAIYDGYQPRAHITDDIQQHFPQSAAGAGGYAVLLAIQLLRDNPDSTTITARIKSSAKSADWIYSNAPTKELIQQTMVNWPPSKQMGPVSLSRVPNTFYFYWPFRKSRLRVHSLGLLLGSS